MSAKGTIASLTLYVNRGITPKYTEDKERAIPVLNQKCIRGHKVNLEPARLNDLSKRKVTAEKILEKYDVLINSTGVGTLGRVAQFYGETGSATVDSHVTIVRPNPELIDPIYFGYLVKFKQSLIEGFAEGTTGQTELARDSVKELVVEYIDDYKTQKQVGLALLAIDKKIEINRQTNQTLEHIAQAIFKSWFVDFEPTRAKIAAIQAGQDPEPAAMAAISGKALDELVQLNSEQQAQLKTTAALFPDALVDLELGEIPEGWEVMLNGDVMDVRDGTHDSPKQSETGFPLVTSKHITSGVLEIKNAYLISVKDYDKVNKRSQVNQGDILLTMIGTVGIPYLVVQPDVNFAIKNVGLFRTSEIKGLKNYFYLLLKSPEMKAYLDARMVGTTQKYLSLKTLRSLEMLTPSAEILSKFNGSIDPVMDKIFSSICENNELSELRDGLLPKLLSGELEPQGAVGA